MPTNVSQAPAWAGIAITEQCVISAVQHVVWVLQPLVAESSG